MLGNIRPVFARERRARLAEDAAGMVALAVLLYGALSFLPFS